MEKEYHLVFISVILVVSLLIGYYFYYNLDGEIGLSIFDRTCGDGTPYNECSEREPYYCVEGLLFERASLCGCPSGFNQSGDFCLSIYQTNPREIKLNYNLGDEKESLVFTVYEGLGEYLNNQPRSISYEDGSDFSRTDFKLKDIDEAHQKNLLVPLVVEIQNTVDDEVEQVRLAISLVQSIEWGWSNETFLFGGFQLNYPRFPYEVLLDNEGVCQEKSELLAFILRELGYGVAIFYNQLENHETVGIRCPIEESWYESGYCFIETSGPSIMTDSEIIYVGGIKLQSQPQVLVISEGRALPEGLYEYEDAEDFMKIRSKLASRGINMYEQYKYKKIQEKYNLQEVYRLD